MPTIELSTSLHDRRLLKLPAGGPPATTMATLKLPEVYHTAAHPNLTIFVVLGCLTHFCVLSNYRENENSLRSESSMASQVMSRMGGVEDVQRETTLYSIPRI